MFDLKGRVAVVTGASSGLGEQMAKALARQGADIAILARRKEKLESVSQTIRGMGVKCLPVECDVTSTAAVQNAVKTVVAEYGKVDILVNNAGSSASGGTDTLSDEQWQKVIDVDLTAVFKVAREFGREMIKNKYGRIINLASMYGTVAACLPNASYNAAKAGVINFTRGLAAEWAQYNITANAICPGFFATELTSAAFESDLFKNIINTYVPMKRLGKLSELDPLVVYLASDEASYTTGGAHLIDGGYTAI